MVLNQSNLASPCTGQGAFHKALWDDKSLNRHEMQSTRSDGNFILR